MPTHQLELITIVKAEEFFRINHPHFGRIQKIGAFQRLLGLLTGISRKAVHLQDRSPGNLQTIAHEFEPSRFTVTVANSFISITFKEDGARRIPIIQKKWKMVSRDEEKGASAVKGTIINYLDSDGLRWEHRFGRELDRDEIVGFGTEGQEVLSITLQTFG